MLAIGILVCAAFYLLIQVIVNDFQRVPGPPPLHNDSNLSLSNLISDSLLNTWIHDPPKAADWKVPHNQHSESSFTQSRGKNVESKSKVFASNLQRGFSKATKETFIRSLLSLPITEVKPDWSVALGTFEYYAEDNWDNYLDQIEIPYLLQLLLGSVSETMTISQVFEDVNTDANEIDSTELGTASSGFELLIVTSSWPVNILSQIRLREPILEHDIDGSDSMNTFFFVTPRLLIQEKKKNLWNAVGIRHFDEKGLNMTMIEKERMVMATRYYKRVE